MILEELKWLSNLTDQEKILADYIIRFPDTIFSATAHVLAMSSYTSKGTVTRLCQKLGFQGFADFKLKYALECSLREASNQLLNPSVIREASSSHKAPQFTLELHQSVIAKTAALLDSQALSRVLVRMKHCKYLAFYGTGTNFFKLQGLCLRLQVLGYQAYAYDTYYGYIDAKLERNYENQIAFLVSTTGNNPAVLESARKLKNCGIWMVAICSKMHDALSKLTDETLITYWNPESTEMMMVARDISLQYVLDTLFISCYAESLKTASYNMDAIGD